MAYLDIKIVFVISCIVAIVIDPLFFFAFAAHEEYKCIFFNRQLVIIISIVRSVTDFIYLIHVILPLWLTYVTSNTRAVYPGDLVIQPKKLDMGLLLDLYILLPLPQVVMWVVLPKFAEVSSTCYILLFVIVLLQYIPKVLRCLPLIVGQTANGFIFEYVATDLLMFVLSGHFVGSCWYLFGLQRMNQCLRNACLESACPFIHCREIDNSLHSWFDFLNNSNAGACFTNDGKFNYGIYERVITLAIEPSVSTQYVHSLIWGVQQISIFADILVPSFSEWEGLFLISICVLRIFFYIWIGVKIQHFRTLYRNYARRMA